MFDDARPRGRCWTGVSKLAGGRQGDAGPDRPQRDPAEVLRLAQGHQGRRDGHQGNRAARPVREHGRQDGQRGRQQDQRRRRRRHDHRDRAGRGDLSAKASRTSPPAPTRWPLKRGIDKAVEAAVESITRAGQARSRATTTSPRSPPISANGDAEIGKLLAEAIDKVGKEGVIRSRKARASTTELEVVEGMQFDKGYISPYFMTNPDTLEAVLEDAYILIHEKKISNLRDLIPLLEKIVQRRQAAADHRRGRRGRGPGGPGGQPAARRAERLRRQGPGLRRPPQGHAGRHRRPHRRQVHQRGPGHQARERRAVAARPGQADRRRQGQHARSSKAPARRRTSRPAATRSATRSRRPPATTTARSSRSAWPS